MKVVRHRLIADNGRAVPYVESPNRGGKLSAHDFLVVHYTGGSDFDSSVAWRTRRRARAAAHLVIGRDGQIAQLVPFDRQAWHAGPSHWNNQSGLNRYSIGIELDNAGVLHRRGGEWFNWLGGKIPDAESIEATHKLDGEQKGWHAYTLEQLELALEVAATLVEHYRLKEVLGHDEIAPERKRDPGPAFPMESFRGRILGRSEDEEPVLRTTANLNIRSGPGTGFGKLEGSPLPKGTRVRVLENNAQWRRVDLIDPIPGDNDLQGWVHGNYLAPE
jgi:N-acetylmuramoyl-L-alanine amidase